MVDDKTKKTCFKISADELEFIQKRKEKEHDEPIKQAVLLLEAGLDKVLTSLGVDVKLGNIPEQQEALGILITEETREEMWGINGFFVFIQKIKVRGNEVDPDIIPYAWVGAARVDPNGECYVDIHWFMDERLDETGGFKIPGVI